MVILFDIGGSNMRNASSDGKCILRIKVMPTPTHYTRALLNFYAAVQELADGEKITGIVGGLPGTLNARKEKLLSAPHLRDWEGRAFKKWLQNAFHTKNVTLENDAALAGLGEAIHGVGKKYEIVAYLTVGTGFGGARITHKKIDASAYGFEPGHQIINITTRRELESLVSGSALTKKYGMYPSSIKREGVWDDVASALAFGLYNTIQYWSPEIIVLGGSIMLHGRNTLILNAVTELKKLSKRKVPLPKIAKATLGDKSGLYGALAILRSRSL